MKNKYRSVDPDYYELFEAERDKKDHSRIFYFGDNNKLSESRGAIDEIEIVNDGSEFLRIKGGDDKIRLDRIISINGKPGPAYDEYDSYANACLDCMGGMED